MQTNEPRKKLVIAGGSGFLGKSFVNEITRTQPEQWDIVILSRSAPKFGTLLSQVVHAQWDGRTLGNWHEHLSDATHLLNLAGRSVDCRKTPSRCDEILRSRVESTIVLGKAIALHEHKPKVWVQMSTAHIYGDPPSAICDEDSTFGYGLAPTVGKAWEEAFHQACPDHIRKVILRTSFVLGKHDGAFPTLRRVAKLGLGGKIGAGTQGISWIHETDMNRIFADALLNENRSGAYIATAPHPISYIEYMRTLRKALHQPIGLPGSALGLRLLTSTVMDSDPELVLYGRYCVPKRLLEQGFEFKFDNIKDAIDELTSKS